MPAATEKKRCFIYRPGKDFSLPPALAALPPQLSEFTLLSHDGCLIPHPEVFSPSSSLADAEFFLFPYDIGPYMDFGLHKLVEELLTDLPGMRGRVTSDAARRHIVTDYADNTLCISPELCLFKTSLLKNDAQRAVPLWYNLPEHTRPARPSFAWDEIMYAASFVGRDTNAARRAVVASIRLQAPELRCFFHIGSGLDIYASFFRNREQSREERLEAQTVFIKALRRSFCSLCPPGVGPQSVRLYESMALGRIPVIFGENTVYPLEHKANYDAFCLRIATAEIMNTGNILKTFFAETSQSELREKCILACKTWQRFFARGKLRTLLQEAQDKFGL